MLRIVMSSIMRCCSGEARFVMGMLLSIGLHKRAILTGGATECADDSPVVNAIQGSEKSYCTKPLRGREFADRGVSNLFDQFVGAAE